MKAEYKLTRREAVQGIVGVAAAAMLSGDAAAEHGQKKSVVWPLAAESKHAQPFNDDWRFHRGDAPGAEAGEFDDSTWRVLDVPHDWSIEDRSDAVNEGAGAVWDPGTSPTRVGPFDVYASEGQFATGWTVGGVGWYRKTFDQPVLMPNGKSELRFGGVYMNCDVWLNGTHLGNHPYGYTEFAYDITQALKDGKNSLAVRINNFGRNSRWYSGSGIFRKVWLSTAGEVRIPANGVYLTTPDVSKDAASVDVEVTVENGAMTAKRANVHVRLIDADESVTGETQAPITVSPASSAKATCALKIAKPHLWAPADPHLYRVEVAIESDLKIADSTSLQIGVRKVEIDAAQGLRINGESFKLRGGCVHHDNGPLGSACIPRAEERRVEILKASGFNSIRTSHNPPSPDFLDACDRLGLMVIDEAFDCWEGEGKNPQDYHLYFKDWWQRDLESMIVRDRNHPCIVLWSIGNEIPERAEPGGVEMGKALAACVHKLDPTRKVTAAIPAPFDHPKQTWQDMQPAFTYLDVGGYNYQLSNYANDHAKFPDRIMVGTESFPSQTFQNWQAIENDSWVIGDFVWTAIDYLGESGIGHASIRNGPGPGSFSEPYPWFNSYCGDIDLIGNKKPQSFFRDVVWRRSPIEIAVQRPVPVGWKESISMWGWSDELRSWTWPGLEGTPMNVRVYSRGTQVKLLLNGREVGSKQLANEDALKAEFSVPYGPGELKAVAYQDGNEIGSAVLTTTGKAHKLMLTADRLKLKASRDDLSYVMVQVADENGAPVPDAIVPVSFTISGAAEIAAVGNANPKDVASFRQPRRDTYHGACLVVIRPTGGSGQIELRADSPSLEGAAVQLQTA
ncbi:MAG: glycoside hydrolase family 2 TIM barrel-domain containing protein [Terracidiphilus sp.]